MSNRTKYWLIALIPLGVIIAVTSAAWWWLPELIQDAEKRLRLPGLTVLIGLVLISIIVGVWVLLDNKLIRPLRTLERGARIMQRSNPAHELELPSEHLLGELPLVLQDLGKSLYTAQREASEAMTTGAQEAAEQRSQLEAVLAELSEGVFVCDASARIVLFNPAALRLLPGAQHIGLGRSIYDVLKRAPVEGTLELLRHRQQTSADAVRRVGTAEFVCSTAADDEQLLHCHATLLPKTAAIQSAFVITFTDATDQLDATAASLKGSNLRLTDLRQSLANLRAAAENISATDAISQEDQTMFQRIVADESENLSERLEILATNLNDALSRQWPMRDVYSEDLVEGVNHRLRRHGGPPLTLVGEPLWLTVDSHSITLLLEYVVKQLMRVTDSITLESLMGNRQVYLDLVWPGQPIAADTIESWMDGTLDDFVGTPTIREVLRRHNAEMWSQPHRRPNKALLRIPLPASSRQWLEAQPEMEARPEFYDFNIGQGTELLSNLANRPLTTLQYVVFDTETTGLEPSKGDEMIEIAGVRVVNNRVLTGETFERLINPGRPIPKASIKFHGITDDQVKNMPTAEVVLKQFITFVGGEETVLVAHNAAFDMKFLKLKEASSGIKFNHPVLDTLLLSSFLHDHADDHNLDAIADRLGIDIHNRHRALGDALATAKVFVSLLALLEGQNIHTLSDALTASDKVVRVRRAQARI